MPDTILKLRMNKYISRMRIALKTVLVAAVLVEASCGGGGSVPTDTAAASSGTTPASVVVAAASSTSSSSSGPSNPASAPLSKSSLMACGTQSTTAASNGQTVTLTVSYGVQNCQDKPNPLPTGMASFYVGLDTVGSAPLVNGTATYSFVSNVAAFTNGTAVSTYVGDTNYNAARTEFPLTQYVVSNNAFANATLLSATPASVHGTLVGALPDTQAPFHSQTSESAVGVWYKWVAEKSGIEVFKISQTGPNMYIFTGTDESHLTDVLGPANPADAPAKGGVVFNAVLGQTYYVAIVASAELASDFVFDWTIPY